MSRSVRQIRPVHHAHSYALMWIVASLSATEAHANHNVFQRLINCFRGAAPAVDATSPSVLTSLQMTRSSPFGAEARVGDVITVRTSAGQLHSGQFRGRGAAGDVFVEVEGQIRRIPASELQSGGELFRGRAIPQYASVSPSESVAIYTVQGNPHRGRILGYTDQGEVIFLREGQADPIVVQASRLDLSRLDRGLAPIPSAVSSAPAVVPRVLPTEQGRGLVRSARSFSPSPEAHRALMARANLLPNQTLSVSNARYHFTDLVDLGEGRVGVLAVVEVNGQRTLRAFYRSNSQGGFRLMPARNTGRMLAGMDKGVGELALDLPVEVQEYLAQRLRISGVRRDVSPEVIEQGVHRNRHLGDLTDYVESPDHLSRHVTSRQNLLAPFDSEQGLVNARGQRLRPPSEVRFSQAGHRPNFSQAPVRTFRTRSALAGEVDALVYRSADGSLEYTVYRDSSGRVWIGSVTQPGAPINSHGVRSVAPDVEELVTPRWEYTMRIPNRYARPSGAHPRDSSYSDAWAYIREFPDIQEWYRAQGLPVPP